jgi:[NiFe] hydrogenase diaphorase moiety small subunit
MRRDLVEMLFHEGNHLCPICEASGNCELQAMAYRLEMTEATRFPYLEPCRALDASHPDIALDTNRCISCGRCIRASQDVDGKGVFGYVGRGIHRRVAVNGENLADTDAAVTDHAISAEVCPVGCIIRKRVGFVTPIGEREFDKGLIGHEIEGSANERAAQGPDRDRVAGRLFRLPHGDPRHRRAADRADASWSMSTARR